MPNNHLKTKSVSLSGLTKIFAVFLFTFNIVTVFDEIHRYLELFTHFKLQYLLASIIFGSVFLALREYKWVCAMTILVVLNLVFVLPWYINSKPEDDREYITKLKLLHSNVHTSNTNYKKLLDLVADESPDILITQEVNKKWITELKPIEQILPFKLLRAREDNFGIAIYSKHPLVQSEVLYLGLSNLPSLKVSFKINHKTISLITTHPLPPIGRNNYESRNSQIKEISLLSQEIESPLVLIGDLNVTMWSKDYQPLEEYANLTNTRKGFGLLPTWPTNLFPFMIPIDHCLVSSEFNVLDMAIGRDVGSDHLPIIVTLGLKK